ncbi:hypothetical protein B0H14DRAFT_3768674 [Mycena olivaceomarginata]|nr:hypothetical protein B0H14DRAFT_3768674 [Mycena olivaceomarginata]
MTHHPLSIGPNILKRKSEWGRRGPAPNWCLCRYASVSSSLRLLSRAQAARAHAQAVIHRKVYQIAGRDGDRETDGLVWGPVSPGVCRKRPQGLHDARARGGEDAEDEADSRLLPSPTSTSKPRHPGHEARLDAALSTVDPPRSVPRSSDVIAYASLHEIILVFLVIAAAGGRRSRPVFLLPALHNVLKLQFFRSWMSFSVDGDLSWEQCGTGVEDRKVTTGGIGRRAGVRKK